MIDQLIEKIELLLLRAQELQLTNDSLRAKLKQACAERDMMQARLEQAAERVSDLLQRISNELQTPSTEPEQTEKSQ